MEYEVQLTEAAPQTIAVVRFRARQAELSTVIPAACGEVWTFIRSSGFLHGGRLLAVYGAGDPDSGWDIECGAEVDRPFPDSGRVVCSTAPAGLAAVAVHWGPYHLLGGAHDAVRKWCDDNGHPRVGICWEVYEHCTGDDPALLRTDVFYLLKSSKA